MILHEVLDDIFALLWRNIKAEAAKSFMKLRGCHQRAVVGKVAKKRV
jgi:hypothetical protein